MNVQYFEVVESEWPDENGYVCWRISDGCQEKGEFGSRAEAEENMMDVILNWRSDN